MQPTRRFWAIASIGVFLAGFAVLVGEPILLFASAAVTTLLVGRLWLFVVGSRDATAGVNIEIDLPQEYVRQNETMGVTLDVTLTETTPVDLTVTVAVPLTATGPEQLEVTVPAGQSQATTTATLSWEIAGVASFEQPQVTLVSTDRLCRVTVNRGPTPSVTVEPRVPRDIHVGEGGERANAAFGGRKSGKTGQGIDPAELREYVPGDDVGDIDWKATARQNDLYVREYEVETDRRTVLLFDHSQSLATGQDGETMCAYLREVALAFVLTAEEFDDPLGLYAVDDTGVTADYLPTTEGDQYRTIQKRLHGIEPTTRLARDYSEVTGPASAARKATAIRGEDSAFAARLKPFFADAGGYVQRLTERPLFDAVRTYIQGELRGETQVVIFTDDTDRTTLRETVKLARGGTGTVVVLLTPRVLFETDDQTDLTAAYEEYVGFESFRRELASIERVSVFEVAPDERLEAILDAGRRQR